MSGGVDSSVALAVLKEQGYDCIGVSMHLWDYSPEDGPSGDVVGGCCSLEDLGDARRVADSLGVPYYVLNMEETFRREVVDYFTTAYLDARTPNPCIKCNEVLKFEVLMTKARALGAGYLATGHYARIDYSGDGPRLLRGLDPSKDQSYFLFTMTEAQMRSTLFPVGTMTKDEVRSIARTLGLPIHDKKESQEICFVEGGSYRDFIVAEAGLGARRSREAPLETGGSSGPSSAMPSQAVPGPITDLDGNVLGEHRGLFNYTIGQRRGLGLSGGPFYVIDMDRENRRLVVGPEEALYARGLIASGLVLTGGAAPDDLLGPGLGARIRYRSLPAPCLAEPEPGGRVRVRFESAQKSITPGQAVVFYRDDVVVGGAWIEEALR